MSQGNDIVLSVEMKADVNGYPFGMVTGSIRVTRDLVSKNDTESTSDEAKASPLRKAVFQCTAQRDPDAGYHTPGQLDIFNRDGFWLRLWAGSGGRSDPTNVHDFPTVILSEETIQWGVANSSASELQLNGQASGDFFLAGE